MAAESNKKIKVIFMGTPDFAVPGFLALINDNDFQIEAVITQKDKKQGRQQALTPPPIKIEAKKHNIQIWQPNKISEIISQIKKTNPDLIVVIAYGQIIPLEILKIPKYGCINVHASLLPKCRGASCIQTPILEGDKKTGITIMKMDIGLDTGPILFQTEIDIDNIETAKSLHDKLSALSASKLPGVLKKYLKGDIVPKAQDDLQMTYTKQLKKEDGRIAWQKSADEIERMARALNPWPGTFSNIKDLNIKFLEFDNKIIKVNKYKVGEIFLHNKKLAVQCGKNALFVKKIQVAGKKAMFTPEFLQGHKNLIGKILN